MSISCNNRTCIVTILARYTKQRRYNPNTDLVVKFLPREFAVELASIILHVKPVEAQFAREIYGSIPSNTQEFLFTIEGFPVKPIYSGDVSSLQSPDVVGYRGDVSSLQFPVMSPQQKLGSKN